MYTTSFCELTLGNTSQLPIFTEGNSRRKCCAGVPSIRIEVLFSQGILELAVARVRGLVWV